MKHAAQLQGFRRKLHFSKVTFADSLIKWSRKGARPCGLLPDCASTPLNQIRLYINKHQLHGMSTAPKNTTPIQTFTPVPLCSVPQRDTSLAEEVQIS